MRDEQQPFAAVDLRRQRQPVLPPVPELKRGRQFLVGYVGVMAFRTRQEQVGRAALAAGRDLLMAMIEDQPYDLAATVFLAAHFARLFAVGIVQAGRLHHLAAVFDQLDLA
ncbi:hypothetical protein KVP70_33210, partial [Duganella sp. HSC-15S17]